MVLRLWMLFLLVCVSAFAPARADARAAENRTWVFLPEVTETRLESDPQVAGTHQENGLFHYEHAPGCSQAAESRLAPEIGRKLDYVLGRATGSAHNVERSTQMLKQLESVGLHDTAATRQLLGSHLDDVLNNSSNILRTQANGRVVRESLLMGPNGGVKLESVWDGTKLITVNVFGGKL